jgi:hypothetical protein
MTGCSTAAGRRWRNAPTSFVSAPPCRRVSQTLTASLRIMFSHWRRSARRREVALRAVLSRRLFERGGEETGVGRAESGKQRGLIYGRANDVRSPERDCSSPSRHRRSGRSARGSGATMGRSGALADSAVVDGADARVPARSGIQQQAARAGRECAAHRRRLRGHPGGRSGSRVRSP